MEHTSSASP
jgi:hypothetical protein